MATETTASRRSLSLDMEFAGRPMDNGLYTVSDSQEFYYGKRIVTFDGKVFKYSRSGASCYTGRGNAFYRAIDDATGAGGIDYATLAVAAPAGSTSVVMTNTGSSAIAEDALMGGQITLKPTETYTDGELMFRTVMGNSAAAATSGLCTIYLDSPTETALTTSNYGFVMPSEYSDVRYSADTGGTRSFGGVAATYVSASGKFFWLQTWGKCWIAPQSGCGATTWYREVYWRHDGSIDIHTSIGTNVTDQRAGFVLDNNASANGSTVIFLQITPV